MERKLIEVKSHSWVQYGRNNHAECFPFANGNPLYSIASCEYCSLDNNEEGDICIGWEDNPDEAPIFCGPICPKFDPKPFVKNLLTEVLFGGCGGRD